MTQRLQSLDVFRGATVAAMLLVNNPGTWSAIYAPLRHAEWHGWTPTDLIFPFFLFIVGITTALAPKEPKAILRRGALIVLFGLLLNAFPYFRLDTLRWSGVLQRIGIVYIVAALIARYVSRRVMAILVAVILLGYWAILAQGPLEPPDATVAARIDRAVLGPDHIWKSAKTWDPEGPLSTIPAVATALIGILVTPLVRARNLARLLLAGAAMLAGGLLWHRAFPINKNLWTSSYVVFTAGFACVILAACIWIIDVRGWRGWTKPFVVYGMNPLIAFLGSGAMARLFGIIKVDGVTLHAKIYRALFKPYFEPHFASLLYALTFVGVWLAILWVLYRRNLILKV
ncbi:MAG TPA: heparan-alpha-glucosaminide N-acetyltransferase domain-containing protein [Thermoanaerobaculia bacterium]|nr:heparan-alpha-glucosaminide N-acetyltransferase domain-containing protein [Thermoanaerobaculia bacterium]